MLHLRPLAIDDVGNFSEGPKRERYEGYVSLVVYGVEEQASAGARLPRQVHVLISGD